MEKEREKLVKQENKLKEIEERKQYVEAVLLRRKEETEIEKTTEELQKRQQALQTL